jgi:hypothetical protein
MGSHERERIYVDSIPIHGAFFAWSRLSRATFLDEADFITHHVWIKGTERPNQPTLKLLDTL